jgi:hypothetical protein
LHEGSGPILYVILALLLFGASALACSNDAQWHEILALQHSPYEKLTLVAVRYGKGGAKTAALGFRFIGESGSYVWSPDVDRRALQYRAVVNDLYGGCRTAPSQYPADDEYRIAVDAASRLWNLDIAALKLTDIQICFDNVYDFNRSH